MGVNSVGGSGAEGMTNRRIVGRKIEEKVTRIDYLTPPPPRYQHAA